MVTTTYALARTPEEYERPRAQAIVWEGATERVLAEVGLERGARCLDAGCGPGETMRLMAERVGPTGRVLGLDTDASLGELALERLHAAGRRQCVFEPHDVAADEPLPGAPFDLVYARLLLFHLPERVEVLARLWDAVAPGGHLLIQDYDFSCLGGLPELASTDELVRVLTDAFTAAGCDVRVGARLAPLFAQAGIGDPDGADVAGRIEPLANGAGILDRVFRSALPAALAHGITTEADAAATLAAFEGEVAHFPDQPMLWPLLIGAWKRKEAA